MKKVIRYGIVGIGGVGANHANLFLQNKVDNACLSSICDTNTSFSKNFPDIPFYTNTSDFFNNEKIDVAIIATPHGSHINLGKQALENNINAIIEKPLAVTTKQCRKFIEFSKKYDAKFGIMLNQRTNPAFIKLNQMIKNEELGKIHRYQWTITDWFRTNYYYNISDWRATWKGEGGGVLMNQSIHQLDLCQWLFGMPCSVITDMKLGHFHNIEVEDEVTSILKYKDGMKGIFSTTTGETPGVNRLEIASDYGLIIYENNTLTWKKLSESSTNYIKNSQTLFDKPAVETLQFEFPHEEDQHIEHNRILQNFTNFLLGEEELHVPGDQGLNSVELINAMLLSGLDKKEIELPLNEEEYENKLKKMIGNNS
ncbi:MAG: oxidoreductase [Rickettsiales bacterium]|nr:oxidoreductase [Rickettsiales bacterium]|tara:strand:- start:578 stop:1684 length:1107 start_codon:yes stop_codon:yes gene_type:complete